MRIYLVLVEHRLARGEVSEFDFTYHLFTLDFSSEHDIGIFDTLEPSELGIARTLPNFENLVWD